MNHRIYLRNITALLLALVLTLNLTGCFSDVYPNPSSGTASTETSDESLTAESTSASETQTGESDPTESSSGAVPTETTAAGGSTPVFGPETFQFPHFNDPNPKIPEYHHVTPEEKQAFLDDLSKLSEASDPEEMKSLYCDLSDRLLEIFTYARVASVDTSKDTTDEAAAEEYVYASDIATSLSDSFMTTCKGLTAGALSDDFLAHIDSDSFKYYADYTEYSEEALALRRRETELENEYNRIIADMNSATFNYLGIDWTFEMFVGKDGETLYNTDSQAYLDVYYGLEEATYDQVMPIFLELVSLRTTIAKEQGYADYNEYAYQNIYSRDYSPKEAQVYCDAIKAVSSQINNAYLYAQSGLNTSARTLSTEDLIEMLNTYAAKISPELTEYSKYLSENSLYDISQDSCREESSYCTEFFPLHTPFIFMKSQGNYNDFSTLTHEFGHFINFASARHADVMTEPDHFDLSEIHSTGLELLFTDLYSDIFDKDGEAIACARLGSALSSLVSGCLYDEFQRKVYENPTMTADEIRDLFTRLSHEYHMFDYGFKYDYSWIFVPHNFTSPLYYLSYSVSSLAALQIWELSQEDLNSGYETWKNVLSYSDHGPGYTEVIEACGLDGLTDTEGIKRICDSVIKHITE